MRICKTCIYWVAGDGRDYGIEKPIDPDTYEEMENMHEVRQCKSPKLLFAEFPTEKTWCAVVDGSNYRAVLYTAEEFGCINHEENNDNLPTD